MVGVRMGDEQRAHGGEVDAEGERVQVCIGREIDEQFPVYERLRAGAPLARKVRPRRPAMGAVTEYGGEPLRRRSA